MKFLILMGSPRLDGNTAELCKPFMAELAEGGAETVYIPLADRQVGPCLGCYACQQADGRYGCVQHDDMDGITDAIIAADCIVLATPIYTWYCTAQMKAVLDRHYGLNKYYGTASGSLWAGRTVAVIATHWYDAAYAAEPFETGVRRLCEHSRLAYAGMYSVRDEDDLASFQTAQAQDGAREFARRLLLDVRSRNAGQKETHG